MALRVLIVDDHVDCADSLRMLVVIWGYAARTVYSPTVALDVAVEFGPDVMLMDIGMPHMDGCKVAEHVRRTPALAAITLVAVTGYPGEEDRRRCREAGFDHFLVKPADLDLLRGILSHVAADRGPGPRA